MTNNIATVTAQIALNKIAINMLHQAIQSFKIWREKANKDSDEVYVKLLNAAIKKNSRQIKQYVVVQKAAKKHLAQMIANSRCSFYVEHKHLEDFIEKVVKEHPEMFDGALKGADWMDSCGKESV